MKSPYPSEICRMCQKAPPATARRACKACLIKDRERTRRRRRDLRAKGICQNIGCSDIPREGRTLCEKHLVAARERYKKAYAQNRDERIRYIKEWKYQRLVNGTHYMDERGVLRRLNENGDI